VTLRAQYEARRDGGWKLLVLPASWSEELWREILDRVASAERRRHPQTLRLGAAGAGVAGYYLKVYSPSRGVGAIKDWFRDSKAVRALKQGLALSNLGFHAPVAVAAAEERAFGALRRAFLLTSEVAAQPLAAVLRERFAPPLDRAAVRRKRQWLRQLALETRRMHRQGFVHGDLVASNILARLETDGGATFFYMDNDRTRRYPVWLPHRLWRRNLVQLNRIVLPGISLQDRMRFLRGYLGEKSWGRRERRLAHWLERRTRKRRKQCERIEAKVSFRELMRWNGPFAKNL
jgi:hypothetical protein